MATVHPRACGEQQADGGPDDLPSVHPRACGEQQYCGRCACSRGGSSPRLRGTAANDPDADWRSFGSSPRLRGTVSHCHIWSFNPAVHPRACGEQAYRLVGDDLTVHPRACGEQRPKYWPGTVQGSSPRLRGTGLFQPRYGRSVHPRACGEQSSASDGHHVAGSSPRLRGTAPRGSGDGGEQFGAVREDLIRFIPAPAGNSAQFTPFIPAPGGRCLAALNGSSPRLRGTDGTKQLPRPVHPRACGSSPRLRGTASRLPLPFGEPVHRFIPAPAGNRDARRSALPAVGSSPRLRGTAAPQRCHTLVHPRACGEQSWKRSQHHCSVHPRACGEQTVNCQARLLHPRFIPAPAGNSSTLVCDRSGPTVAGSSPRLRGTVSRSHSRTPSKLIGSSPRLRGTVSAMVCTHDNPAEHGSSPRLRGTVLHSITLSLGSSPRLRGTVARALYKDRSGSSPRLRGTASISARSTYAPHRHRFIPAPAGNSHPPSASIEVHPRACGEQIPAGRPPLIRFIPAPAGNSLPLCH